MPEAAVSVFLSYSFKDEEMLNDLNTHLQVLVRAGKIQTWCNRDIEAGDAWELEIRKHIDTAEIIMLLISANFMASEDCYEKELKWAIDRQEAGKALVIPVLLKACAWELSGIPFQKLQVLPDHAFPIAQWEHPADAFSIVTKAVSNAADQVLLMRQALAKKPLSEEKSIGEIDTKNDSNSKKNLLEMQMPNRNTTSKKRFDVALSFPGEYRNTVEAIALSLSNHVDKARIFYDKWYEAELAMPNLDTYLQSIYHHDAELVVVFFCPEYQKKDWCGLEWRAIRDLIKQKKDQSIMLAKLSDAEIPGLFGIDGYMNVLGRAPSEIANLILQRLKAVVSYPGDFKEVAVQERLDESIITLSSESGVQYSHLQSLLISGSWKYADQETLELMYKAVNRQKERWFRSEDIRRFPSMDLSIIDRLWRKYSQERFGFSVQRKVWEEHGSPPDNSSAWMEYCRSIGWIEDNKWKTHERLSFDISAPVGHLPCGFNTSRKTIGNTIWSFGDSFS
jgi:hypothetical protein